MIFGGKSEQGLYQLLRVTPCLACECSPCVSCLWGPQISVRGRWRPKPHSEVEEGKEAAEPAELVKGQDFRAGQAWVLSWPCRAHVFSRVKGTEIPGLRGFVGTQRVAVHWAHGER